MNTFFGKLFIFTLPTKKEPCEHPTRVGVSSLQLSFCQQTRNLAKEDQDLDFNLKMKVFGIELRMLLVYKRYLRLYIEEPRSGIHNKSTNVHSENPSVAMFKA